MVHAVDRTHAAGDEQDFHVLTDLLVEHPIDLPRSVDPVHDDADAPAGPFDRPQCDAGARLRQFLAAVGLVTLVATFTFARPVGLRASSRRRNSGWRSSSAPSTNVLCAAWSMPWV